MTGIICGIDPGMTGAIAYLWPCGNLQVEDMPLLGDEIDAAQLCTNLATMRPAMVFIEGQQAMPGQGVSSTFKIGRNYGMVRAAIACAGVPTEVVSAGKWKKFYQLGKDKEASRAKAALYWPGMSLFARKKDHNRAEAALIARYGAKVMQLGRAAA